MNTDDLTATIQALTGQLSQATLDKTLARVQLARVQAELDALKAEHAKTPAATKKDAGRP